MEKQEVSKRIQVYLPAELARQVEQLAKAEHMTLSSCCTTIIGDAVQEMNEDSPSAVDPTDDGPDEAVHIHLYRKEAALLKRKPTNCKSPRHSGCATRFSIRISTFIISSWMT